MESYQITNIKWLSVYAQFDIYIYMICVFTFALIQMYKKVFHLRFHKLIMSLKTHTMGKDIDQPLQKVGLGFAFAQC